jgi:hypothetical protein
MTPEADTRAATAEELETGDNVAEPDGGDETAERHLYIAPDLARRRRRTRLLLWGTAVVSAVSVFVLVAFHVIAVQYAFTLDRLNKERSVEERRYERLRVDVSTRSAPAAIAIAARELGMVQGGMPEYIDVPQAAPRDAEPDDVAQSLSSSYGETKPSLAP